MNTFLYKESKTQIKAKKELPASEKLDSGLTKLRDSCNSLLFSNNYIGLEINSSIGDIMGLCLKRKK